MANYCTYCGSQVSPNAAICTRCGRSITGPMQASGFQNGRKFCPHCGTDLDMNAAVCVRCGYKAGSSPANDNVNAGLVVVSVLVPIFGIVYWAIKQKECPKSAKYYGIASLISWGAGMVLSMSFQFLGAFL